MKDKKKIVFVTGSYPPQFCGVGDYTSKLLSCLLKKEEFSFDLFYKSEWSLKNFLKYYKELLSKKTDFYHFQYPTEGYGYSFLPLFLIVALAHKNTVTTIHELSSRNLMAYIYTLLLVFFSKTVIVSNELERKHASRFLFNSNKIKVIPIASNINASDFSKNKFVDREIDLAYFGHIRPLKGIEDFIETVSFLPKLLDVALIGQSLKNYELFFDEIKEKSEKLNIKVIANKEAEEVANILSNVKIVYLPFPDGVSNRRGTLLASIQNGCVVVSTESEYDKFNIFFGEYCYLVKSNSEAVVIIEKLLNDGYQEKDTDKIKDIFSWDNIANQHIDIYST